jgi:hypothetical protein
MKDRYVRRPRDIKKIWCESDPTATGSQKGCSKLSYRSIYVCNSGRFQIHLRIPCSSYSGYDQSGYRSTKLTYWLRSLTCCVSWSISKNLAVLFSPAKQNYCKSRCFSSVSQQAYTRHGIPYYCTWKTVTTVLCFPAFYEIMQKLPVRSLRKCRCDCNNCNNCPMFSAFYESNESIKLKNHVKIPTCENVGATASNPAVLIESEKCCVYPVTIQKFYSPHHQPTVDIRTLLVLS